MYYTVCLLFNCMFSLKKVIATYRNIIFLYLVANNVSYGSHNISHFVSQNPFSKFLWNGPSKSGQTY